MRRPVDTGNQRLQSPLRRPPVDPSEVRRNTDPRTRNGRNLVTPRGAEITGPLATKLRQNQPDAEGNRFHSTQRALQGIDEAIVKINTGRAMIPKLDFERNRRTYWVELQQPVGTVRVRNREVPTHRIQVVFNQQGRPVDASPVRERTRPVVSLSSVHEQNSHTHGLRGTAWDLQTRINGQRTTFHVGIVGTLRADGDKVRADVSLHLRDAPQGARLTRAQRRYLYQQIASLGGSSSFPHATRVVITDRTNPGAPVTIPVR